MKSEKPRLHNYDVLNEASIHRTNAKYKKKFCFDRKRTSLVKKGQNMLHKLSFDANSMVISYWEV